MSYWWVNQGASYRQERAAGILWAPKLSKSGSSLAYWESMALVEPGDTVLHYADQHVKAVGVVLTPAVDSRKPADLPEDLWDPDGRLVRVRYVDSDTPVFRDEIPEAWRRDEPPAGPFQRNLGVKLGYLFPLSDTFGADFLRENADRFPALASKGRWAPAEVWGSAEQLARDLIGRELRTITGSPNRILGVSGGAAVVATNRSPHGEPVPLTELASALERLRSEGSVVIEPSSVGYRSAFIGAVLLTLPGATVYGSPPVLTLEPATLDEKASPQVFVGELSVPATAEQRGEQAALRRLMFGGAPTAQCAICGHAYPTRFLVAAHIKRRAVCSDDERRDLSHVAMPACVFGCDALFEAGHLAVDDSGTVRSCDPIGIDALDARLAGLEGSRCLAHTPKSAAYFDWHRTNIFLGSRERSW